MATHAGAVLRPLPDVFAPIADRAILHHASRYVMLQS